MIILALSSSESEKSYKPCALRRGQKMFSALPRTPERGKKSLKDQLKSKLHFFTYKLLI